jgi:uncharacterized protein GlcG (DUF336 family)
MAEDDVHNTEPLAQYDGHGTTRPVAITPIDDHQRKGDGMLTLDQAMSLCTAARDTATELGAPPMSFAVMDAGGHLLAFARMDGAPWVSADVALGKAWTSAAYGVPSAAQKEKMAPMPNFATALITMTNGRFTPQTGAVPIYRGGALQGALGASGGTGEQDQDVCARAVAATGFSTSS